MKNKLSNETYEVMSKKSNFTFLLISLFGFIFLSCDNETRYLLNSPEGRLQISVETENNKIFFSQKYCGEQVLAVSPIGLMVDSLNAFENISIKNVHENLTDYTWETVNGKNQIVRNYFREYIFDCEHKEDQNSKIELVFRCYDHGFAYRFVFPDKQLRDDFVLNNETTRLNFIGNYTYWAYNGENHTIGPANRMTDKADLLQTPVVLQLKDSLFVAIHEAEIINYAPFTINAGSSDFSLSVNQVRTTVQTPGKTSWRAFMMGKTPGDMVESDLLVNLNEPCKIEDTSWIKPGKSVWDWRVWGYRADDGFVYGLNSESHKRFIDFASENNIQYLLIDADWYGPEFSEGSDPTEAKSGINIQETINYASQKNVGIILYLNDIGAKKFGMERVLKQFAEWGAKGVKYGFMTAENQEEKVKQTRRIVELCAKYRLIVDFHDNPVAPSGDQRTWPNLITKEFCHAQADAKRSYYPETAVNTAFINMIAGPVDITAGWFGLNNAHQREKVFEEIPGTVVAEVAKLIVYYSGLTVLPDSPEEYRKKKDLFGCIKEMPPQYDSFDVLDGKIDEYIVVARKAGNDWFIGSLTNRKSRSVVIDFGFLPSGKKYLATIYEDAPTSNYLSQKEMYQIKSIMVDSSSTLVANMAEGGGQAIHLTAQESK